MDLVNSLEYTEHGEKRKSTKKAIYRLDPVFQLMDDHAAIVSIKDNAKSLVRDRLNMLKHRKTIDKPSVKHKNLNKIDSYIIDETKSSKKVESKRGMISFGNGFEDLVINIPEGKEKSLPCNSAKIDEKCLIDELHSDSESLTDVKSMFFDVLSIAANVSSITVEPIGLSSNIGDAIPEEKKVKWVEEEPEEKLEITCEAVV